MRKVIKSKNGNRIIIVKSKPILSEAELKLLKSIVFAVVVMGYGLLVKFSNGWLVTIVFGIVLWIYLREIYGVRNEFG